MTAATTVAPRNRVVAFDRLRRRVGNIDPWWWPLLVVLVIWTWYFTSRTLDVHHGMGTSSYDLGLYDQGVWLLSRFRAPFVTLMGRNLFGDHTSFVMVLLVPIYWVAPSVGSLLFVQSAVIAAGAVPVFLYARQRLASGFMALVLGAAYLATPAVGWANLENFHPDSFLGLFVGMAIWAALSCRWRTYAVFVVLSLLVKEDVSLVIVPLGVWVALRRDRRIGLITIVGAAGFTLVAMFVVMRSLIGVPTRNTWRIPFGGLSGLISTAIKRPAELFDHLSSEGRPFYMWQMIVPAAWASVRRPTVAAIGLVVVLANSLSTFWYQHSVEYHYSLVAVPALTLGAVHGIAAMRARWHAPVVMAVAVTSMWASILWGPLPWSRYESAYWAPSHPGAVAARQLFDAIPSDASVSAHHRLTPHLSHRTEIYQFPNPFRILLYGTDISREGERLEGRAEGVDFVMLSVERTEEEQRDWDEISSAFDLVEANEYWQVYRRAGPLRPPSVTAEEG
jgi:uncharacterized membrane protein